MDIVILANRYKVHHFKSLEALFHGRFVYEPTYSVSSILSHEPKLVICFDEHYCEIGAAIAALKEQRIPVLQVMDGILEWRRTWEYTRDGVPVNGIANPLNQPALADKIACLGYRDARILSAWGNTGKCEIVGAPRLDGLLKRRIQRLAEGPVGRRTNQKQRVLVMTAKTPGFTPEQVDRTLRSLGEVKRVLGAIGEIEVIWRLTQSLDAQLGIVNKVSDLTGGELHQVLSQVDAVITTPSTSMLEAMLLGVPVALLDYHNCPHYFESAWNIGASEHILDTVHSMLARRPERMFHQEFLLEEQLQCRVLATARLAKLIEHMIELKPGSDSGREPSLLENPYDMPEGVVLPSAYRLFYPHFPIPDDIELRELKTQLAASMGTNSVLRERVSFLERRLDAVPGYRMLARLKSGLKAFRRK